MRRREFLGTLSAAAAWPIAARAQQSRPPIIGVLSVGTPSGDAFRLSAFRQGLAESSYAEGRNITIEYRYAENQSERLSKLVGDLIGFPVAVIVVVGGAGPALVAKGATSTIPVVFATGGDPVKLGLVSSLNRPGYNVTGVSFLVNTLVSKQFEALAQTVTKAAVIGFLVNPQNPNSEQNTVDAQVAANAMGRELLILKASTDSEIEAAFAAVFERHLGALLVAPDPYFADKPTELVALAAHYSLPTGYPTKEFVEAGGLLSYGTSIAAAYRQVGVYAGRILKGEKPADLPVQQSVQVELAINMKTAKALGLTFPITLLGRADEVIE
jgi:putative tryptophan/tyrosine transport system substrate-binding protein